MDCLYAEPTLLGLRRVRIPRCENGFGFTLRHFIVYPPDVCEQSPIRNGETADFRLGKVTEPVDTIFVKSVREDGPADRAGLAVGDRIVSVNGDRVVGKSYDQVVHLIQNSAPFVYLEVSPKQYDTLQLFYEDKAYRPETNQRPSRSGQRLTQSQSLDLQYYQQPVPPPQEVYAQHLYYQPVPPPRTTYPRGLPYATYATLPNESSRLVYRHLAQERQVMSSAESNQPSYSNQFSHLPRPPPYKSNFTNWSHINTNTQSRLRHQPQVYYPFQNDPGGGHLWGIREEAKSSESVLGGGSSGSSTNSNRYGSMECISNSVQQPITWKNSPGYRFSISTAPGENSSVQDVNRREMNHLQGPPGGFISPTAPSQEMIVTMSGGANEMPSDRGMRGYELKMEDRIRKSMEQKEEFLRRPAQPVQWLPLQSTSSGVPFPKEFYAQPQKFQKVPWPPENRTATEPTKNSGSVVSDELMTVSMRSHPTPAAKHLGLTRGQMEQLRTTYGGSLDETTCRRLESVSNKLHQQQSFPKSSSNMAPETGGGRNRVTLVGTGKLHCDPPKGWKHPTISFDETETHVQNNDADVILRKREVDPGETDRLVRRVSYLKATSSPIDMDQKHSSPATPTKSPSSEFPQFGSFPSDKSADSTEVIREGQVHFKVRAGDAKKGGYYRSWRQGWAQIRRSGCLYLSKERIRKETITGTETDVILCIGLKDGVSIEQAEGATKRKNVLRIRTCAAVETNTTEKPIQAHQSIPVEILIQGEDLGEMIKWIQVLQEQQDNNNRVGPGVATVGTAPLLTTTAAGTSASQPLATGLRINPNEMSSPRSLLRNFLPQQSLTVTSGTTNSVAVSTQQSSNYLTVATSSTGAQILAVSPKSKTWKGRVAKQWKKIHPASSSASSTSPLHSQTSIPESGATFGVPLETCPQSENSLVPRILEYCVDLVETKGLGMVGIYRIPGNNAAVTSLTESLNKGNDISPEADPRWTDVHVISSLLKKFLRQLPDPLLTASRYPEFIKAAADPDIEKGLDKIRLLVQDLPDINYETLRHLIFHLRKVADHFERNRMDPRNLAIVFGPTVVRTADENVAALVNDMQHQCKIVELLINKVEEIFKEKEDSPTPPEELGRDHSSNGLYDQHDTIERQEQSVFRLENSSPPKIENDIRTSLIQAALRKKQGATPPHNTYGLPPNPVEKDRSVDESGLIRSYTGLELETEQRVRQFEIETRAHLCRDTRSPGLPTVSLTVPPTAQKIRLEAEWRRAKADLENEDFYDQLADNPSTIVRGGTGYHQSINQTQNLSNSSVSSSTNSGETLGSAKLPPYPTWPIRLGPVPFKTQFSAETLPPKAPFVPAIPPFPGVPLGMRRIGAVTPPLRKINSMERLSVESEQYEDRGSNRSPSAVTKQIQTQSVKTSLETSTFDSRMFGSLDSLQNLANGSKENLSSDGSDLVSSLSRTLEEKMERLRTAVSPGFSATTEMSRTRNINGKQEGRWGKGLMSGKRRNSLIETRRKISVEEKTNGNAQPQSCGQGTHDAPNGHRDTVQLTLTNQLAVSKKSKDIQRRHSLGTVDILRFVLGDGASKKSSPNHRHSDIHISTDTLATALKTNNIVESHV